MNWIRKIKIKNPYKAYGFYWRRHPDLNRGSRCCRPMPYHLAIAPINTSDVPFGWSGLRGSNSLPPPWQGGALPDELNPHNNMSIYQIHTIY